VLKSLIRFSIDHAALVVVIAGMLLAVCAWRLPDTQVDVFPELNAPTVVVMAESPGLAADEVEQLVTLPLEGVLNGIPGVRRLRSASAIGLAIAYVEFEWGTDIYRARQQVSERLDSVEEDLPAGTHAEMTPITSITGEIMLLALSSPDGTASPLELRSFAEFELRNRLRAIPGVAQVSVIGGELPEYQVLVEQERLRLYDLTLEDVAQAAAAAHSTQSAGYLEDVDNLELPVRQSGRVRSVRDIEVTPIKLHGGAPTTIADVAEVRLAAAPRRGTGSQGGRPAVVLTVQKAPGTNTLVITREIDALLDDLEPSLPQGMQLQRHIFRQADFIERAVDNVVTALRDAALIVALVLALFLLNLRTTLVTLTALPLSLAAGLLVLHWLGESINVMTLGGLAIAVGSLVDDAIIDVENVFRRLGQNARLPEHERRSKATVIFDASNEIRPAMVFATIIIVLVFAPLGFLGGIEGRFFRPLGIAFVVSLLASLLVALTVTPALCRLLLHAAPSERESSEGPLVRVVQRIYRPALNWALRRRALVLGSAAAASLGTLGIAASFGSSFLPEFNEGTLTIGLFTPPGTSLPASDRLAGAVELQLLELEGVRSVTRRTGRAERDEHVEPVSNSELELTLLPGFTTEEVRAEVSRILEAVPGITTNIGQPIEHRLSHILSGTPAAIAIDIYGEELASLRLIAAEVEAVLRELPGTRDVAANREVRIQSLPVEFQPEALAAYGLTPRSAASQVRAALFGVRVAEVHDGPRRYGLAVRLQPEQRDSVEDLHALVLRGMGGALVRLSEVAEIGPELTPSQIARENSLRKAVVSLNVAEGENLGDLVARVEEVVDPIVQRHGYTVNYGGQFEAQRAASRGLMVSSIAVLLVMIALLHLATGSLRVSLLVLVNLPLALIGGVLAVFLTGSPDLQANLMGLFGRGAYVAPVLSIASLVGFITLFGIAVRNGILLTNHYDYLIEHEQCTPLDAILRGSTERLVPILMTALTAALALLPIALEGDQPGNEILSPLSTVILGGLLTSTFLNLVVVPAGYAALRGVRGSDA